jgi:hypothetical protein
MSVDDLALSLDWIEIDESLRRVASCLDMPGVLSKFPDPKVRTPTEPLREVRQKGEGFGGGSSF